MQYVLTGLAGRLRRLTAAAALATLATLAGAATAAPAAAYTVPNPYATGPTPADVKVRKLVVFGDSFSKLNRKSFRNWAEQLRYDELNRATGLPQVATLVGRAVSGATAGAYPGSTNDFATQVTDWLASPRSFGSGDLTVVYLGHNDLEKSADLTETMADYRAALRRVLAAGAAGGSRRVLLVMPHDWGRSPYYVANGGSAVLRRRTQAWNGLVAAEARRSSSARLVAVDLFTAMECVFEQPARFGLTNVTAPRPSGGDPRKYLYDYNDRFHFGPRGQALIRQVVQYYLTRGWDWSNTYKDPATARRRLTADLEAGRVFPGVPCSPAAPTAATTAPAAPG